MLCKELKMTGHALTGWSGVKWPNIKQGYCQHPEMDCFPTTACPKMILSSNTTAITTY